MAKQSGSRDRILNAARDLFHAHGYHAVSIRQICEQAQVNQGSFYYFFKTKKNLLLQVIGMEKDKGVEFLQCTLDADLHPLGKILYFFQLVAEYQSTFSNVRGCPIGNLILEIDIDEKEIHQTLQQTLQEWSHYFETIIREIAEEAEVARIDVQESAQNLLAYFQGTILMAKMANNPDLVRQRGVQAIRFIAPELLNQGTEADRGNG